MNIIQENVLSMLYKLEQGLDQLKIGMYLRNMKEMASALKKYAIKKGIQNEKNENIKNQSYHEMFSTKLPLSFKRSIQRSSSINSGT